MHSSSSCYLRVNCIQFTFSVLASKMLSRLVSFELCDRELQIGAQYYLATAAYSILENSPFFLNTHTKKLSYILFFPQNPYILFSIFDYLKICPWISLEKTRINHWNKLYSLSCHLFIYKPTATILLAIARGGGPHFTKAHSFCGSYSFSPSHRQPSFSSSLSLQATSQLQSQPHFKDLYTHFL